MILVNGEATRWHEGMTVQGLLDLKKFKFPLLHVRIDDTPVPRDRWASTPVPDLARVEIIHMMSGG